MLSGLDFYRVTYCNFLGSVKSSESVQTREIAKSGAAAVFLLFDVFADTSWKDDIASMEYPFFALSAKPVEKPVEHTYNGRSILIRPSQNLGLPTIYDKDIFI